MQVTSDLISLITEIVSYSSDLSAENPLTEITNQLQVMHAVFLS